MLRSVRARVSRWKSSRRDRRRQSNNAAGSSPASPTETGGVNSVVNQGQHFSPTEADQSSLPRNSSSNLPAIPVSTSAAADSAASDAASLPPGASASTDPIVLQASRMNVYPAQAYTRANAQNLANGLAEDTRVHITIQNRNGAPVMVIRNFSTESSVPVGPAVDPTVFPSFAYTIRSSSVVSPASKGGYERTACTICITEFEAGEQVRLLPCLHSFHCECIDPWLEKHANCPMCQQDVRVLAARGSEL